jgi:hypothetical protein
MRQSNTLPSLQSAKQESCFDPSFGMNGGVFTSPFNQTNGLSLTRATIRYVQYDIKKKRVRWESVKCLLNQLRT